MAHWLIEAAARTVRIGRPPKEPKRETNYLWFQTPSSMQQQHVRKRNYVTLRNMSNHPLMRKAINAIKNPIAGMKWYIGPNDGYNFADAQTQERIRIATFCVANPNGTDSFRSLIEQILEDALVVAAGTAETRLSGDPARPVWIFPVDGATIVFNGKYKGDATQPKYLQDLGNYFTFKALNEKDLMYIKPNPTTYTPFGRSPVEFVYDTINDFLTAYDYANKVSTDAVPNTLIDLGEKANAEEVQYMRMWFRGMKEGTNAIPVTGGRAGMTVHRLFGDNDMASRIIWLKLLILVISQGFGLSPMSLGLFESTNRATAETQSDLVDVEAIKPWAELVAEYINRHVFWGLLGWYDVKFKWSDLEKIDQERQTRMDKMDLDADVHTPDEIRARKNLPPHPSGIGALVKTERQILLAQARGTSAVNVPPGALYHDDQEASELAGTVVGSDEVPAKPKVGSPGVKEELKAVQDG